MVDLQKIKDEVAVKHGYMNFKQLIAVQHNLKSDHISAVLEKAMKDYGRQCCQLQIEACAERDMKQKHDFKPVRIGVMIGLLSAISFFACTSCEASNDTECNHITQQYMQSLQYAETPEAVRELERQYQDKLNKAGC